MIVRPMTPRVVDDRGQDIPLPRGTMGSILIPEDTVDVQLDREADEIVFVVGTTRTEPRGKVLETQTPLAGSDLDSHIVLSYD